MPELAYVNGRIVPPEEASVPIYDRACTFGDGVYEVVRIYGGRLFAAREHAARLEESARAIRLSLPWGQDELLGLVSSLVARSGIEEGLVYIQVSRGVAPRSHAFPQGVNPSVVITVRPFDGLARASGPVRVITRPDIRWRMCRVKSLNLLPNVLLCQEAHDQGCAEALLVDSDGRVNEGTHTNFFAVVDGVLRTAGRDRNILAGITRGRVIGLARDLGITVVEEPVSREELAAASEAFLTSTIKEVLPVGVIDGIPVGTGREGPVTRRLRAALSEQIKREVCRDDQG